MVVLNKIYTRTGDAGNTGLSTGERVVKFHTRISAYGTVDETNSQIGMVRLHTGTGELDKVDEMLARVQNDLFDLGADLCTPDRGEKLEWDPLRISLAQVQRLETEIDDLNDELEPLRSFVLPGGHAAAAGLHVCRTVSRRAERLMVELSQEDDEPVSEATLQYINRLSDFFFVASRWVNAQAGGDVLWVPGANR